LHGFTTLDECRQHLSKFADTFELSAMDGTVLPLEQWPLARVLRGENLRDLELYVRHLQAGWKRVFSYGGTLPRDADGQTPLLCRLIAHAAPPAAIRSALVRGPRLFGIGGIAATQPSCSASQRAQASTVATLRPPSRKVGTGQVPRAISFRTTPCGRFLT